MIKVSENAKTEVTKLLGMEGRGPQHFVRVGVKGGGCSGLMYDLIFDNEMKDGDKVFEDNGVKVVIDKKSMLYLLGTTLDFSGGLNGKGFQFINPNASRTCGCGESFKPEVHREHGDTEKFKMSKRQGMMSYTVNSRSLCLCASVV